MKILVALIFTLHTVYASAQTDTLAYAIGYKDTMEKLSNYARELLDSSRLQYIKGMEENKFDERIPDDSEYRINYSIGGMQGMFMLNNFEQTESGDKIPVNCLIDGLVLVAENKLTLPEDTIAIRKYMSKIPKFERITELPDSIRCTVLKNVAIQWAFRPDLADNVKVYSKSKDAKANYLAFARGMADALMLSSNIKSGSDYDLGKKMIRTICLWVRLVYFECLNQDSFIEGVKAAMGITPLLIDKDVLDKRIERLKRENSKKVEDWYEQQEEPDIVN